MNGLGRIGHVHLKDQRGRKGVLDFPVLGEGEIDLPRTCAISRLRFPGA